MFGLISYLLRSSPISHSVTGLTGYHPNIPLSQEIRILFPFNMWHSLSLGIYSPHCVTLSLSHTFTASSLFPALTSWGSTFHCCSFARCLLMGSACLLASPQIIWDRALPQTRPGLDSIQLKCNDVHCAATMWVYFKNCSLFQLSQQGVTRLLDFICLSLSLYACKRVRALRAYSTQHCGWPSTTNW